MTTIGQLRHKVKVQQQGEATNAFKEKVADWLLVCEPWCDIRQPSGLSAIKADMPTSIVRTSVRMRYRKDVKPGMRIVHGERIYDIKAGPLSVDGKREFIDFVCEEKT